MGVLDLIERNRRLISRELAGKRDNWYFSAITLSLYRAILPIIGSRCRGRVLDAGAGTLQFKSLLSSFGEHYESLDIRTDPNGIDHVGDIQDMPEIGEGEYDTVFCNQVLEHLPSPASALREMNRILKRGGVLILAAPHLSRLHEEPNDYYRYTAYGLDYLLKEAGFTRIEISTAGGLLCFLAHQASTVLLTVVWGVPYLRKLVFFLNKVLLVQAVVLMDEILRTKRKFPLNNIALAFKS